MFGNQGFMGGTQVVVRASGMGAALPAGGAMMAPIRLRMGQDPVKIRPGPDGFEGPLPGPRPAPAPGADATKPSGGREDRLVRRLCDILRKFADKEVSGEVAGRIFWSYVDHANMPPDMATTMIQRQCPDLAVPPRPTAPAKEMRRPEKEGFHGKTRISYEEAKELSELLAVVLAPLTPEEAASELADRECLREMTDAGGFPIVERLQERLQEFLATAQPTDTFEISHGEAVVTGKAVECAEALGRIKTVKTVATVGGAAVGGTALLLLLGIL